MITYLKTITFTLLCFVTLIVRGQGLIGTPNSLILVYNQPDHYYYLEVEGTDKRKTDNPNLFILDNRPVQFLSLNVEKFLNPDLKSTEAKDTIEQYIRWELQYIQETLNLEIESKLEFLKSEQNKDIAFWTYEMPLGEPKISRDSTTTTATQKQMFVLTLTKNYLVAMNSPIFEEDQYDEVRAYLIRNIDGLVASDTEIDLEALNAKVNSN